MQSKKRLDLTMKGQQSLSIPLIWNQDDPSKQNYFFFNSLHSVLKKYCNGDRLGDGGSQRFSVHCLNKQQQGSDRDQRRGLDEVGMTEDKVL